MTLKIYLRYVNPVVSIVVLLACTYAATTLDDNFDISGIWAGSIATYFFAKGLFCSSALFIMGKILEIMLVQAGSGSGKSPPDWNENA